MSLGDAYQEQFDLIEKFMADPGETVRCVRVDPEMKDMFLKALVKMEEDPDNPHLLVSCAVPYANAEQFFDGLLDCITREYENTAQDLREAGVEFNPPAKNNNALNQAQRFVSYVSGLADSFPDSIGSLVLLLDPEEVSDKGTYELAIRYLATKTASPWAKYLVLDRRVDPDLGGIEDRVERTGAQTFYVPPDAIEQQAKSDLAQPAKLTPPERRAYLGLVAGFAFSKKKYDDAARLQEEQIALAEKEGEPPEAANGYYNLGNTRLEQKNPPAAEDCYCKSLDLCLEHKIDSLTPLVMTNLGIALHRQKRMPEAIKCFRAARAAFRAQNQPPGEAHALDCLASMCYQENGYPQAEEAWLEALKVYEGITSDAFADVRKAGREDIIAKLERLYRSTGQRHKIPTLKKIAEDKDRG
jgi:tetratricopeptide (TPR) repeat protein